MYILPSQQVHMPDMHPTGVFDPPTHYSLYMYMPLRDWQIPRPADHVALQIANYIYVYCSSFRPVERDPVPSTHIRAYCTQPLEPGSKVNYVSMFR